MTGDATIIAALTEAQRQTLLAAKPLVDGRILVPSKVQRRRWRHGMTDIYSVAMDRLTPLGLSIREELQRAGLTRGER